ncbi:MAG: hypothetical protein GY943_01695 [Chloroflexi bacterium]|nr:hypothetical protein [Chloroflexota bacterium]
MKFHLSNPDPEYYPLSNLRSPQLDQPHTKPILAAVLACDSWLEFWSETAVRQSAIAILQQQWPGLHIPPDATIEYLVGQNGHHPQTREKLMQ